MKYFSQGADHPPNQTEDQSSKLGVLSKSQQANDRLTKLLHESIPPNLIDQSDQEPPQIPTGIPWKFYSRLDAKVQTYAQLSEDDRDSYSIFMQILENNYPEYFQKICVAKSLGSTVPEGLIQISDSMPNYCAFTILEMQNDQNQFCLLYTSPSPRDQA
eukprot:TRINITY_DN15670_c0_g1_i2.p1 TRINITY_DN15670_c0_g1~~TRINITY_DN15670_c0_g1_i2.p1  ORF type:complete len:159 (-),score=24.91 TRINITY_DN15670_c0_g1_i2:70-546(-)